MKNTRILFAFLSVYIIAAFGWWTYAHILSTRELEAQQTERIEILCYKATLECRYEVSEEFITDTNAMKDFMFTSFPELEIVFLDEYNPLENFMIRPRLSSYEFIENKYERRVWMYLMEGVVMVLILFWGIIWVYRSLLQRLQLNRMQNNFLLSITHELKTPLASIKLYLETILKRNLEKEQVTEMLTNSVNDVNRLRDLVDNILVAAQLDGKKFELHKTDLNLSELVNECVEKYATPRNLKQRIICELEENVIMRADPNVIEIIAINLLSNAYKYTSEGNKIFVKLRQDGNKILFHVADEGKGISDADKKDLFKKFFRAGDENTRKTRGTGLGLYIVKNLLNLMNGEILVKNNQPQGTIFEITFNI